MNSTQTLRTVVLTLAIMFGLSLSLNLKLYLDNSTSICSDYGEQVRSKLQMGVIDDITKNYTFGQLSNIRTMTGLEDTKAIHFSLDSLDKFIYNIKRDVLEKSPNPDTEELGLRLYLAAYPELDPTKNTSIPDDLKDLSSVYSKRLTVVFLPTIKNSNNMIVDFDPTDIDTHDKGLPELYETDENGDPTSPTSNTDPKKRIPSLVIKESAARNHGQVFPPYPSNHKLSFN